MGQWDEMVTEHETTPDDADRAVLSDHVVWDEPDHERPLWRRVAKWTAIAVAALLAFAVLTTLIYRWQGPFSTWNMRFAQMGGQEVSQSAVNISRISSHMVRAVIAAEDSRFCQHDGFDVEAIRQAIAEKEARGYLRGASTISQQTAKNAFMWNGGGWLRKGGETGFTFLSESFWTKRRIMEVYLNVAEWGDGIYGVQEAARARFGVDADRLTRRQAAQLAAVLPSPNKWRLDPPGPYVRKRTSQIMARMNVVQRDRLDACVWE